MRWVVALFFKINNLHMTNRILALFLLISFGSFSQELPEPHLKNLR